MPTWYSIKNRLEAGEVKARNEFERFLTGFVTSYGCIDVWYNNIDSNDSIITCRLYYIQKDVKYTAAVLGRPLESWERNQERPEYWLQLKGTVAELRASIISLLPRISQLHNKKRHGEWNFGATQPFEGQGSIVTIDQNTGKTIITGRFGDIVLNSDGTELNWEDIVWSFDGCDPTATAPAAAEVCFRDVGSPFSDCRSTSDPTGTCVCGTCCQSYSATYPLTQAECTAQGCSNPKSAWVEGQDLSNELASFWFDYFNCTPCPGTCVTGTCSAGYTDGYPVQNSQCSGTWFGGRDLSGQTSEYWETYFGCLEAPTNDIVPGCCVIGNACDNYQVSVTTQTVCAANASAAGLPHTWTEGIVGQNGSCNLEKVLEDNNCFTNERITISCTFAYTSGAHYGPCYTFSGDPFGSLWWAEETIPAITPGSPFNAPDFYNEGDCASKGTSGCVERTVNGQLRWYSEWTKTGWQNDAGVAYGTITNTFVFKRDDGQDPKDDFLTYSLETATATVPYIRSTEENVVSFTSSCGSPCITGTQTLYDIQWKNQGRTTLANAIGTNNKIDRIRFGNDVTYSGQAFFSIPGQGTVAFNFDSGNNPAPQVVPNQDGEDCSFTIPQASGSITNSKFGVRFLTPTNAGTRITEWGDNLVPVLNNGGEPSRFMPINAFKTTVTISEGS